MKQEFLIKNATVVNEGRTFVADVLVSGGKIARIWPAPVGSEAQGTVAPVGSEAQGAEARSGVAGQEAVRGATVIDATGKLLIPGVIDEHVHFREPGLTHKADISTESRAAVCGGVTSFMDMPNTVPQTTTRELLERKFDLAAEKSLANYSFYIGATNDNLDEVLGCDFGKVCGIKLFMGSSTGDMLVDKGEALEALFREAPCLIAAHCEDEEIIRRDTARLRALAAEGRIVPDASIHPLARSAEACLASSARAVELAAKTGARLHVLHVSTAAELSLFRSDIPLAQKKITAETCPHYLCFSDADYPEKGFAIKCNPAIKSASDRNSLLEALGSGLIDTVGSDHAPHLWAEKSAADCFGARSGFPSVQHTLQLMMDILPPPDVVRLMCHNPATLYRIDRRGFIREGYFADLVLLDPGQGETITDAAELTKCGWSPYSGRTVRSKVTHTFVGGNLVYENGLFHEEFRGQRLLFG